MLQCTMTTTNLLLGYRENVYIYIYIYIYIFFGGGAKKLKDVFKVIEYVSIIHIVIFKRALKVTFTK